MTAIALLVQPGATPSSVMTTLDMFAVANRFLGGEVCRVEVLSAAGGALRLSSAASIDTGKLPERLEGFDAVIAPGFFAADLATLLSQLHSTWQPVAAALGSLRGARTIVAASCHGTFVLAESGLLDGCKATTAWWFQRDFAERYPRVDLQAERALVDDGAVVTAGAMTAHTELSMQVLRRLHGAELARSVASIMLVDGARTSQQPFVMPQRSFADPLAQQAAAWLAENIARDFSAEALAATCHASYRTLHRRFSAAAGMPPLEYLQLLRVERAKSLLENSRMSVDGIVAEVGYTDVSSFRRLFVRLAGLSPAQYRRRFQRGG